MAEFLSDVDGQLLSRLDSCAELLGASRAEVLERALRHYLDHADDLKLAAKPRPAAQGMTVDWAEAKRTLVASHCPYPSCPHQGDCPIELCPL